jgi:hypothetical protein
MFKVISLIAKPVLYTLLYKQYIINALQEIRDSNP